MQKRKYKKMHPFPYNPMKQKILRIGHTVQPHALVITSFDTIDGKRVMVKKFCDCPSDKAYLEQIKLLNPTRYEKMVADLADTRFFSTKRLSPDVVQRRRLSQSLMRWK